MKGLMVVDIQECYVRNFKEREDVAPFIEKVNQTITNASEAELPIIYISHQFTDVLTSLFMKYCMKGMGLINNPTFRFDPRIKMVNENMAIKNKGSALSTEKTLKWIEENSIDEIVICGLDGNHCINASARDSLKKGLATHLVDSAIIAQNRKKWSTTRQKLMKGGVTLITPNSLRS